MKCKHCTKNYKDCEHYLSETDSCGVVIGGELTPPTRQAPTALEALKELKYQVGSRFPVKSHDFPPQATTYILEDLCLFEIIESALKELEDIKSKSYLVAIPRISNKTSPIDELLLLQKVLEIIKEKRVDPFNEIIDTEDYEDYLSWYDINRFYTLTQEEYELLKEVLK